jgi:tetratricopeptide (TPR) repeat protein
LKLGKVSAAIQDYDTALTLIPRMPTALYGRGLAELKAGDDVAANRDIEAAEKLNRHIRELFSKLGVPGDVIEKPQNLGGDKNVP